MKIKGSNDRHQSWLGVCLSLLLGLIMSIFLYTKVITWRGKKDVDIMSALVENEFDYTKRFDSTHGFFVAAALTEYDSNTEIIEKPEYGELIIEQYGWGYEGEIGSKSTPIDYDYCSDEELGFTESSDTLIFPVFESSITEVETFKKKFKCVDKNDLVIWGDFNSPKAQ